MNIVTGQIAHPDVNADDTVNLRQLAMNNFKAGRPGGEMKIKNSKSTLKLKFEMVISELNSPIPETVIYDDSAFLCVLTWLSDEIHAYIDALLLFVHQSLQKSNVTLVFDRYFPNSTKHFTRMHRWFTAGAQADTGDACSSQTSHSHQHEEQNSTECHARRRPAQLQLLHECNTNAGVSDVPVEIVGGVRIDRHDLCSTHEVANIVITQRAISCSLPSKCIRVVCDDNDVFVLLVLFYHIKRRGRNSVPMIMTSLMKERAVVDIGASATALSGIADDLRAIHGISGVYTVASLHGVGKATIIKIAKREHSPSLKLAM